MGYTAEEFRNVATVNRSNLMKKLVYIPIGNNNYQFRIAGIGPSAIKLENYFRYTEIIKKVQEGIDDGLEYLIEQIIIDPNMKKVPMLDSSSELRARASANKQALRRMSIESFVGVKNYEFRLAGIGGRAIKLEIYVAYEDIAKELNEGNKINLEFILKEILVGNKVDYGIFEDIDPKDYLIPQNEDTDDAEDEIEEIVINKLSSEESEMIISKIEGIQKLIFDSIDDIDSDVFVVEDVLDQDRLKSYAVQGKSLEPLVIKNIDEFVELGIIITDDNNNYYKLW